VKVEGQEKVKRWMAQMSSKATTPESRNYVAQLNSLLNFYTKPAASENIPV
jgi:hypothetical protein